MLRKIVLCELLQNGMIVIITNDTMHQYFIIWNKSWVDDIMIIGHERNIMMDYDDEVEIMKQIIDDCLR